MVQQSCHVLDVSRSGYYEAQRRCTKAHCPSPPQRPLPLRYIVRLLLASIFIGAQGGSALAAESNPVPVLRATAEDSRAALWMSRVLGRYHLNPTTLDEALSEKIFKRYLDELDPERAFLSQADLEEYAPSRTKLGDAINSENLTVPFALFNLVTERMGERYAFTMKEISKVPNFTLNESVAVKNRHWAESPGQLRDLWRKSIKRDWLELRLIGVDDSAIAAALARRNDAALQHISNIKHGDVLTVFLDAYAKSIDPHSSFQAHHEPVRNDDDARQPGLVGLGFTWRMTDGVPTLFGKMTPPNAADAKEQLDYGDRLLGVAQGADGPMESIIGYPLKEVIRRLRGPEGSTVMLDVLPANSGIQGQHRRVVLPRQAVSQSALQASSTIIVLTVNGKQQRVGIINLPMFYEDSAARKRGENFKSSAHDVSKLLQGLREAGIDKAVLDLRANEGGSLLDVFAMARLFIPEGPIGQQVSDGKVEVYNDLPVASLPGWDGLLAVLISRHSAAGAEIFAAAAQDYGRGLILGETSFANGTVQTDVNLDRFSKDPRKHYGVLRLTVSQYFRNSGKSIQMHGVSPDISLPVSIDASATGEALLENALPKSERAALTYKPSGDLRGILLQLRSQHDARMRKDIGLQKLQALAAQFEDQGKKETTSLNENERRNEIAVADRKSQVLGATGVANLDAVVLQEAARILIDEAEMLRK